MNREKRANLRVEKDLWDRFVVICRGKDQSASQVIRRFIRETVEKESRGKRGTRRRWTS